VSAVVSSDKCLVFIEYVPRIPVGYFFKVQSFRLASYLTDPVCKAHEFFRRMYVVNALNPTAFKVSNWARKFFIFVGIVINSFLAIGSTIPGACLRSITSLLEKEPFIYHRSKLPEKQLEDRFSLLSWNICCVGGGYSISDGGVMPWSFRIDKILAKIVEQDADIISLYEVLDTAAGFYLYEKLQEKYVHFYFNIGPRAIGPSSGIFIASKVSLKNPKFIPFPKSMLIGRTQNSEKGVFFFTIQAKRGEVEMYTTHLQHSEEPQYPTKQEIRARNEEMKFIMEHVTQKVGNVIVTGDLNLDTKEYMQSFWSRNFQKQLLKDNRSKTWGGDKFCAEMIGKRVSSPSNLDYTLATKKSALKIETSLIAVGYDSTTFNIEALSDHQGLLSLIAFNEKTGGFT
jgi:endonuclease/exonuclease/phosphatase family metal-dependent hydrolase